MSFAEWGKVPRSHPALLRTSPLCLLLIWCSHATAQTAVPDQARLAGAGELGEPWAFSASAYTYFPPENRDYLQPTLTADRNRLHLEARYNYEALDTGSAWLGYNFTGGDKLQWELTPMIGGIFGKVSGVGPGYRGSLQWNGLELASEGEYVFDTANKSDSYLYNWSELRGTVLERLTFGVVVQHTRVYRTDREVQRGLLAGFAYQHLDLTGYVFNPDDDQRFVVIALTLNW